MKESAYAHSSLIGNGIVEPRGINRRRIICSDTHTVALLQLGLHRAELIVDDGKLHLLAHLVMYLEGKVNGCSTLGQHHHLTLRGKHIDIIFVEGRAHILHEATALSLVGQLLQHTAEVINPTLHITLTTNQTAMV